MKLIGYNGGEVPMALRRYINEDSELHEVSARYPVVVNDYWLKAAEGEGGEALLAQALPDVREISESIEGDSDDPFAELAANSPMPGLVHRFPDRVLVVVCDVCAMRCRHCTRKNLLGVHHIPSRDEIGRMRDYVAADPKIREVLLSGGDPLMLDDGEIEHRIDAFASLEQIYSVRIGTRMPCTYPERITPMLAEIIGHSKKVWVNTQFNHPAEITKETERACALLVDAGVPVSCQTVLLRGVNDDPDTLEALFRGLQRIRVRPYYAFCGDPVHGTAHFRVTKQRAGELEAEVARRIGGLALPRFVADVPGAERKVALRAT